MAVITYRWTGDGIARLEAAVDALAGPRKIAALRRALNHTGDKTYTIVKRRLVKQMGLPSQKAFSEGRMLVKRRAGGANGLVYQIVSHGGAIRMRHFRWRATGSGITAYPWGVLHHFKSAFVIRRYGGNLYRRRTARRFPLEALYGPNISKELVKDEVAAAFYATAAQLPARVEHEVRVITRGVVS